MRTSITFLLSVVMICGTASAQQKELKFKDLTAEDFSLAEEQKKTGLGEIGKVSFKFAPKKESPLDTYIERTDGTTTHTWHQTLEKKGRLYITDSILTRGIELKLYVSGHQTPGFRETLYRQSGAKVKKLKIPETMRLIKEENDTIYYQIYAGALQAKDILEISYSVKTELNKAPIWYPINDISPGSFSQLDFAAPSLLKYRFRFEHIYEDDIEQTEYSVTKTINVESFDSVNPDGSGKIVLKKLRHPYEDLHDVFTFNGKTLKRKLIEATLIEEKKVDFK